MTSRTVSRYGIRDLRAAAHDLPSRGLHEKGRACGFPLSGRVGDRGDRFLVAGDVEAPPCDLHRAGTEPTLGTRRVRLPGGPLQGAVFPRCRAARESPTPRDEGQSPGRRSGKDPPPCPPRRSIPECPETRFRKRCRDPFPPRQCRSSSTLSAKCLSSRQQCQLPFQPTAASISSTRPTGRSFLGCGMITRRGPLPNTWCQPPVRSKKKDPSLPLQPPDDLPAVAFTRHAGAYAHAAPGGQALTARRFVDALNRGAPVAPA